MMLFGYFKGLPYDVCNENFSDYLKLKNSVRKEDVVQHIKHLEYGLTSLPSKDIFTGHSLQAGIFVDGDFRFPYEFLHYYENYDIGIPPEYEKYLIESGALSNG